MASLIFNSFWDDLFKGSIDLDSDSFKCMLVTSTYAPDKDIHTRRSDVTDEVVGAGYSAGGEVVTVTPSSDTVNDREEALLEGISLPTATVTARGAVYYKDRGGMSSADELICYIDFGADKTSSGGTWELTDSLIRLQN